MNHEIGVVVIGRNEGTRLHRCLESIMSQSNKVVYVDSDSSDNSVPHAQSLGIDIIQLDMIQPFSAARARNEGFHYLLNKYNDLHYIQFVDGDCEVHHDWLTCAYQFITSHDIYAIVAGRTKERFPDRSIYNLLCDLEWHVPEGDSLSCGGIFLVRSKMFQEVAGFNSSVIAGEEPELCYRLRQKSWKIFRTSQPMVLHDAAITKFRQWWMRMVRSGYAYANGLMMHGAEPEHFCARESLRIWFWALVFPITTLGLGLTIHFLFLALFCIYGLQFIKITRSVNTQWKNLKHSGIYAFFTCLGRWPQLWGQVVYLVRQVARKKNTIIEYK